MVGGDSTGVNIGKWRLSDLFHHHLFGSIAPVGIVRSPDSYSILFYPGKVQLNVFSHLMPFLCCQSKM
jgi:hypothetical protein